LEDDLKTLGNDVSKNLIIKIARKLIQVEVSVLFVFLSYVPY